MLAMYFVLAKKPIDTTTSAKFQCE